jgi:putative copper export protein
VIADVLFGGLRLAHALAAALWVGGALTYLLVAFQGTDGGPRLAWRPLREALRATIGVFVVTGVIMAMQRLSSAALPPAYFAVLLVKVGLAIWLFSLGRFLGTASGDAAGSVSWWKQPVARMLGVGIAIYGLATVLSAIYERALRG